MSSSRATTTSRRIRIAPRRRAARRAPAAANGGFEGPLGAAHDDEVSAVLVGFVVVAGALNVATWLERDEDTPGKLKIVPPPSPLRALADVFAPGPSAALLEELAEARVAAAASRGTPDAPATAERFLAARRAALDAGLPPESPLASPANPDAEASVAPSVDVSVDPLDTVSGTETETPTPAPPSRKRELQDALEAAVLEEDYAQAAKLRDELRALLDAEP